MFRQICQMKKRPKSNPIENDECFFYEKNECVVNFQIFHFFITWKYFFLVGKKKGMLQHLQQISLKHITIAVILIGLVVLVLLPPKIHKAIFKLRNIIFYAICVVATLIVNIFVRQEIHELLPSISNTMSWIICLFPPCYFVTVLACMFMQSTN